MTSRSRERKSESQNRADYGFARARDVAFDAVQSLWRKRKAEGMKQTDIAKALGHHPAWVNRKLRGPGNWTLRTFGELVEAMNGEIEITVYGIESPVLPRSNVPQSRVTSIDAGREKSASIKGRHFTNRASTTKPHDDNA
jgi:hypothetical protein